MKYVGIDLHKKTIVLRVVDKDRKVLERYSKGSDFFAWTSNVSRLTSSNLDRFQFVVEATATYEWLVQLLEPLAELKSFASQGPESEQRERAIVQSAPGVGEAVCEVVLAELANADRFGSIKQVTAYAGLVPGKRESEMARRRIWVSRRRKSQRIVNEGDKWYLNV
jgi:transposase